VPKETSRPLSRTPIRFSGDKNDPPYWPQGLMAIENIDLLGTVSSDRFQALHGLVDQVLREEVWRTLSHAETPDLVIPAAVADLILRQRESLRLLATLRDRLWRGLQPAAAPIPEIDGYEADALTAVVYAKTMAFREALRTQTPDNPTLLLALTELPPRPRVLDCGGACGAHYFQASAWTSRVYDWWVVETPAMVARARPLETDMLHFVTDVAAVEQPDLVFASGCIQYAPDALALLRRLLQTGAPRIVLCRWPLSNGPTPLRQTQRCRLSDHGEGPLPSGVCDAWVNLDVCILPRRTVEIEIAQAGYIVRAAWTDPSGTIGPHEGRAYILAGC
jgi:putative methyltransferase (TIGR04325 family)